MTPQQKAKELIDKFKPFADEQVYPKNNDQHRFETSPTLENAKQSALIAVDMVIAENERAKNIAKDYQERLYNIYLNKKKAGNELAFVQKSESEVARYIRNSIDGRNALSIDNPNFWQSVRTEILNFK